MITGKLLTLADGTMGCDVTSPLNAASARQLINKGYGFVVRYVGRADGSKTFVDLSAAEAQIIVDAGLALCVVQHPLKEGWTPTQSLGKQFGDAAANLSGAAGLLLGATVWLDLEGVKKAAPEQDVIDYCNAWFAEVTGAGYASGVYIGANPGLSDEQLYWDLKTTSYWRGGSSAAAGVPVTIPNRGYQMTQRITGSGASESDSDVVHTDNFGGMVIFCGA